MSWDYPHVVAGSETRFIVANPQEIVLVRLKQWGGGPPTFRLGVGTDPAHSEWGGGYLFGPDGGPTLRFPDVNQIPSICPGPGIDPQI